MSGGADGDWSFGLSDLLTVVACGVALFCAYFTTATAYYASTLKDGGERRKQLDRYRRHVASSGWPNFRVGVDCLMGRIERWYGYKADDGMPLRSWQPWGRCFQIAFVYPVFLFLLTYSLAGRGDIAGLELLNPPQTLWQRLLLPALVAAFAVLFFVTFRREPNGFERLGNAVARSLAGERANSRPARIVATLVGWIALLGTVGFAFAGVYAVAGYSEFAAAVAFVGAVAGAGAGSFYVTVAVAFLIACTTILGIVLVIIGIDPDVSLFLVVLFTFFFVLPLVNSLLDWGSLSATRWLVGRWLRTEAPAGGVFSRYASSVFLDLAVAVACVAALSAFLAAGLAGLNALLAISPSPATGTVIHLNWPTQMADFRTDPFGGGLMVTLMLFSTLIPTLAHLAAGTAALWRMPDLGRETVVTLLEADPDPAPTQRFRVAMLMTVRPALSVAAWMVVGLLFLRFFVPVGFDGWVPDDYLLLWLPHWVSDQVWSLLGAG